MTGEEAAQIGLACVVGKCDADCKGPQPDPWDRSLMWPECPGRAAFKRADIDAAMTVRGLASLGFTVRARDYASHVIETMGIIESERAALREARQ